MQTRSERVVAALLWALVVFNLFTALPNAIGLRDFGVYYGVDSGSAFNSLVYLALGGLSLAAALVAREPSPGRRTLQRVTAFVTIAVWSWLGLSLLPPLIAVVILVALAWGDPQEQADDGGESQTGESGF